MGIDKKKLSFLKSVFFFYLENNLWEGNLLIRYKIIFFYSSM